MLPDLTPQERLALAVTALLLAVGAGVRVVGDGYLRGNGIAGAETLVEQGVGPPRGESESKLAEAREAARPLAAGETIDPNTATAVQLRRLPRVGPALAARIVARREAKGAFRTLADLDSVAGVGPALLAGIAPHLTLPPAPSAAPAAAAGTAVGTASASGGRAGGGGRGGGGAASPDAPVDVNRAGEQELQALPGVGPALARRIVEWRAENGPFRTPADLEKVRGIGPKMRERIEPLVRLGT